MDGRGARRRSVGLPGLKNLEAFLDFVRGKVTVTEVTGTVANGQEGPRAPGRAFS
jgi:hypothetical protein